MDRSTYRQPTPGQRYLPAGLLVLALIALLMTRLPQTIPAFRHDGNLTLVSAATDEPITELEVEIAADPASITKGLMYRESMADQQGMLFDMGGEEPRSFWMLNTYIALDIIFVGADRRIVSIRKNTTPRSTDQVRSGAPAAFVLEVNAGFAEQHGLKVGDELRW